MQNLRTILKPNFIFYNIIDQKMKAECLNFSYSLLSLNFDR